MFKRRDPKAERPAEGSAHPSITTSGQNSPGIVGGDFVVNYNIASEHSEIKRKQWRPLAVTLWQTVTTDPSKALASLAGEIKMALYEAFNNAGYTEFFILLGSPTSSLVPQDTGYVTYSIISHKASFCAALSRIRGALLERLVSAGKKGREQFEAESNEIARERQMHPVHSWPQREGDFDVLLGPPMQPVRLRFDPQLRYATMVTPQDLSTDLDDYPGHLQTTSEMLEWWGTLCVSPIAYGSMPRENYRAGKVLADFMDGKADLTRVRVNVSDDEEWDYLNPQFDAQIKNSGKS